MAYRVAVVFQKRPLFGCPWIGLPPLELAVRSSREGARSTVVVALSTGSAAALFLLLVAGMAKRFTPNVSQPPIRVGRLHGCAPWRLDVRLKGQGKHQASSTLATYDAHANFAATRGGIVRQVGDRAREWRACSLS